MKTVACLTTVLLLATTIAAGASSLSSIGPMLGFPIPAHDVGDDQLGVSAGLSLEEAIARRVTLGVDVVYHYWPVSPGYKAALDRFLAQERLLSIVGPSYAFQAIQVTPHLRVNVLPEWAWNPWVQIGGGVYVVDRNLVGSDPLSDQLARVNNGDRVILTPGWNVSLGCDARTGRRVKIGLAATLHRLEPDQSETVWGSTLRPPRFIALTTGLRLQFGW